MSNDDNNPDAAIPLKVSDRQVGQSQDAIRHQKDAVHHKFHKGPVDGKTDQQLGDDDAQQIEGQQPEIPKVGSRDAPGG
jgi:hypothetical protein